METPKPVANIFATRVLNRRADMAPPSSSVAPSSSPAFGTPAHPIKPFGAGAGAVNKQTGGGTAAPTTTATILPILLPPATLRPVAFRTFTKKHGLTLTSAALQELATFIGRHCGVGWREEGLAERVLEEAARAWKARSGGVIVDVGGAAGNELKEILRALEGNMVGGKVVGTARGLGRQNSLVFDGVVDAAEQTKTRLGIRPSAPSREDSQASIGMSGLDVDDDLDEEVADPRQWLKVINAYDQPRLIYDATKKHFERDTTPPSLFPPASHKTTMFRNRYNIVHQRLMRNESFQASTVNSSTRLLRRSSSSLTTTTHTHRLTPIANLLGRHGSHHLLLGLLTVLPWTGGLALCDPTGTVALDLSMAQTIPADSAWFCPGMLVLVDGVYETEGDDVTAVADAAAASSGKGMAGGEGIGGVVGGRFQGFFIGQPPAEKRRVTLGVGAGMVGGSESMAGHDTATIGGGFGWIDFLGVGSERAVGRRMRALERRVLRPILPGEDTAASGNTSAAGGRGRIVFLGEVNLDQPRTLQALRRILTTYASEAEAAAAAAVASSSSQADDDVEDPTDIAHQRRAPAPGTRLSDHLPLVFVLTGSFTSHPLLARGVSSTSSSASAADGVTGAAGGGSIEYKEHFDSLASVLSEFPVLLRSCTFVFVPGDNDGWVSAFTAGAATPLPRRPVPDVFTSRVRRAFATAAASAGGKEKDGVAADGSKEGKGPGDGGQAVFTSNPARLSLFGPSHEIVLFRDDITARLRRTAIRLKSPTSTAPTSTNGTSTSDNPDPSMDVDATGGASSAADPTKPQTTTTTATTATSPIPHDLHAARKLVKTILDQGYLSPFPLRIRPVHWDLASSPLHVYPLPSAMLLADPGAPPFCVTYEGCHVVNPGTLLVAGRKDVARWVEYRVGGQGRLRECVF